MKNSKSKALANKKGEKANPNSYTPFEHDDKSWRFDKKTGQKIYDKGVTKATNKFYRGK